MSSEPSLAERELLLAMEEHERQYDTPADGKWLRTRLMIGGSSVSNRARSLREKGYLKRGHGVYLLTSKAADYLKNSNFVFPTEIPIRGRVRAGQTEPGELYVEMNPPDEVNPTISIPSLNNASEVYLLQVLGKSMEAEHIMEGDLVLVRDFRPGEWPRQGQLVIAKYLAKCDESDVQSFDDIAENLLRGPVLKYYYQGEQGEYRLSTRKDHINNRYTIKTRYVRPIAIVIELHRNLV